MQNEFYVKYLRRRPFPIDAHFDAQFRPRRLATVAHLISAFKSDVAPLLDAVSIIDLVLKSTSGTIYNSGDALAVLGENGRTGTNPLIIETNDAMAIDAVNVTLPWPRGLLNPQIFRKCEAGFYNSIMNAKVVSQSIVFQDVIPCSSLKSLYIRQSYKSIEPAIKSGINRVILTGTPGIGKTMFLFYILWKKVMEKKRVLFNHLHDIVYYDGQGNVFELVHLPLAVDHQFWSEDLWCLFDAKEDEGVGKFPYDKCTFILSTSPKRDLINDFKKSPLLQVFYIPIWSKAEMNRVAYLFNAPDWESRYSFLGGIPRFVFEITTSDPNGILYTACKACDLDLLIQTIGLDSMIKPGSKVVHSLIHMTSSSPFTKPSVVYASKAALEMIIHQKGMLARQRIRELLVSCEGEPLTASLCGSIFEDYAIDLLQQGGTFQCRRLVKRGQSVVVSSIIIPSSTKMIAKTVLQTQMDDQLYVPQTKNFAGIDAWIPNFGGFQMTISLRHAIKADAIPYLKILGKKLYWMVPPSHFHTFTLKKPHTVEQYVLLVNLPPLT